MMFYNKPLDHRNLSDDAFIRLILGFCFIGALLFVVGQQKLSPRSYDLKLFDDHLTAYMFEDRLVEIREQNMELKRELDELKEKVGANN